MVIIFLKLIVHARRRFYCYQSIHEDLKCLDFFCLKCWFFLYFQPDEMKGYDIDLVGSYDLDPEVERQTIFRLSIISKCR